MESKNSILFKKRPLKSIDTYKRNQKLKEWKDNRSKKFTSTRSLNDSASSQTELTKNNITNETLDESAAPGKTSRYQRLLQWKAEKEQRMLLEKQAKASTTKTAGQVKSLSFGPASQKKLDVSATPSSFSRSRVAPSPHTSTPLSRSKFLRPKPNLAKSMVVQSTTKKTLAGTPNTSLKHSILLRTKNKCQAKPAATPAHQTPSVPRTTTKRRVAPTPADRQNFSTATKPASTPVSRTYTEKSFNTAKSKPAQPKTLEGDTVYLLSQARKTPLPRMLMGTSLFTQRSKLDRTVKRTPLQPRNLNLDCPITSPTLKPQEPRAVSTLAKPITSPRVASGQTGLSFAPRNFSFTAPSGLKKPNFMDLMQNFLKNATVFKYSKKGLESVNCQQP